MTDEFQFTPKPAAPKKRKRNQTAPMIASVVTPAIVMIGFLVYLDRKGFFEPPTVVRNEGVPRPDPASKRRVDPDGGRFFPETNRRRPLPPAEPRPGEGARNAPPAGGNVADPVMNQFPHDQPVAVSHPPRTGWPAQWELVLDAEGKERFVSEDLAVTRSDHARKLEPGGPVWVYFDAQRGKPVACFQLSAKRPLKIGLVDPQFGGMALVAADANHAPLSIEFRDHKRHGTLRQFASDGSTRIVVRYHHGQRLHACVCDQSRPAYLVDYKNAGTPSEFFVELENHQVMARPVNRGDKSQAERADLYAGRLSELESAANEREAEWRQKFSAWVRDCNDQIKKAIGSKTTPPDKKKAGEEKVKQLRADQSKLCETFLNAY